ncbi:hypothetical protein PPTG_22717 [Phytophthora nicotianae INRA-310]|uniref:Uncharacterized protein n=1 Tax=Phytophthora nicotianae (strain INRA-310) TaxID=761204 RepID=W2QEG0_PHYN3|nr:hypothetical protein PPTG_22717 [Phytophthora nicotianae INRA-310]ETN10899.1 hypothetical protein PPTG_22717 [Phytophthora nicotianae INRA-310]
MDQIIRFLAWAALNRQSYVSGWFIDTIGHVEDYTEQQLCAHVKQKLAQDRTTPPLDFDKLQAQDFVTWCGYVLLAWIDCDSIIDSGHQTHEKTKDNVRILNHFWGGRFRRVPAGFHVADCSTRQCGSCGDVAMKLSVGLFFVFLTAETCLTESSRGA